MNISNILMCLLLFCVSRYLCYIYVYVYYSQHKGLICVVSSCMLVSMKLLVFPQIYSLITLCVNIRQLQAWKMTYNGNNGRIMSMISFIALSC